MLPRSQQLFILILGLALTALWGWREVLPSGRGLAAVATIPTYFVDIQGQVPRPGLRRFTTRPTLALAWQAAGGHGQIPAGDRPVATGSRLTFAADGTVASTSLSGVTLVTLGIPLDLNQASAADLEAVPGLGPVLAHRITTFRAEHGPFRDLEGLLQVKGIGPKLLEKIRPYVVIIEKQEISSE